MAVRTYNPSVRVGNWNEDVQLEEDTLKDFLERRERGELLIQQSSNLLKTTQQPMDLSTSRDGYVHFGDKVMVYCQQAADQKQYSATVFPRQECVLAINFSDPSVLLKAKTIEGPCPVTGTQNCAPTLRTVFKIVSVDESANGEVLQYGQPFQFQSVPEAGSLYLLSDNRTFNMHTEKSRHQEVILVNNSSFMTQWAILYRDPLLRLEMEGNPVVANTEIVIKHCKTGQKLAVEENHILRGVYGKEYEISANQYLDSHRFEGEVNRWMLRMRVPGDDIQPVQDDKPTS